MRGKFMNIYVIVSILMIIALKKTNEEIKWGSVSNYPEE